jgi:hypothetical protein
MILDKYGQPLQAALPQAPAVPGMRTGGWAEGLDTTPGATNVYGIDRKIERRASRIAFYTNPLISGTIGLLTSYVVGDDFSYGTLDDKDAQLALDEFWSLNNLSDLGERIWTEYLIDGESAVVFEQDAPSSTAAYIGLVDVDSGVKLEHDTMNRVTAIETQGPKFTRIVFEQGEFVWTAHNAHFNDPRGWPVMMQAVPAALSYIGLINARLRLHDLQARINGVYKALYDPKQTSAEREAGINAKAAKYARLPRNGNILTLAKNVETGQSEELEFLTATKGSSDAASDARLIRLLISAALNIPPTWLGDAEDSNRASASEMNGPPLMAMKRRQSTFRSIMTRIFRLELLRRFGPEQRYLVRYSEEKRVNGQVVGKRNKTKRVPAELLEPPWILPQIDDTSQAELTEKVRLLAQLGLASKQTQQELMGLDVAEEAERLGSENNALRPVQRVGAPEPEGGEDE